MFLKTFLKAISIFVFLSLSVLSVFSQGFPKNLPTEKGKYVKPGRIVPNEYIFKLVSGTSSDKIKELLPNSIILNIETIMENTYKVTYKSDPGLNILKTASSKSGFVESVQHNLVYRAF
ncbi:hypothetical protein CH352_09060 [Leptospira hartskeerlii]|uniref:Uncharacterized protein n=1 Tax=Leptospira hartskeerlii TaxID=2023177 RepID=A0A2M9XHR3_9LEPT|nr:hypothetical protein [Leptospira hartskeerlii]PJZ27223.1 hypothetical protein CH357_01325 [Leptospira hartskeerlii]PJZ33884.1 hypothetical protein CH352_09060 [Leptospira hartskeerlii]